VTRTALREGHEDYQLLTIFAQALIRSGVTPDQPEFAEARTALEKSVAARPNYASSQVALGNVYLLENRFDAAIEHLQIARQLSPNDASVLSLLAMAYRKSGHLREAEATLIVLAQLNRQQMEKISSAPGERKAIPGSSGIERPDLKSNTPH
jgi:Flp pilus assembly protein TadD